MTKAFIVDASVAIAWVHPGPATRHTEAMLDAIADAAALEVPALWPLAVANALVVLVRRRKLTDQEQVARTTRPIWNSRYADNCRSRARTCAARRGEGCGCEPLGVNADYSARP